MNAKDNGNSPANVFGDYSSAMEVWSGLTKRELFAAMAMQGLLADSTNPVANEYSEYATFAVEHADALLVALAEDQS